MLKVESEVKAVLFDLGYTLINFNGSLTEVARSSYLVLADGLIQAGCNVDRQTFAKRFQELMYLYYAQRDRDFLELPVYTIVIRVLEEFGQHCVDQQQIVDALHAMYLVTEQSWQLEDDTLRTLRSLREQGYDLGLVSNASDAWDVNNLIDNNQLREFFKVILISADLGIRKPDRRIFEKAASALGLTFTEMVMVGDTLTADIYGAKQCGMGTIWISRRAEESRVQLRVRPELAADAEIRSLSELPPLLQSWDR
jgi:putative hydrolase of the HAD superfamily